MSKPTIKARKVISWVEEGVPLDDIIKHDPWQVRAKLNDKAVKAEEVADRDAAVQVTAQRTAFNSLKVMCSFRSGIPQKPQASTQSLRTAPHP